MIRPTLAEIKARGRQICPGAYAFGDALHFDLDEMLVAAGYPATPENVQVLERAAREIAAERGFRFGGATCSAAE